MAAHPSALAVEPYCSVGGMLFCRGFETRPILPLTEAGPAALAPQDRDWDILLTAETHNFPCAVAPYPGTYRLWGVYDMTYWLYGNKRNEILAVRH